MSDGDLIFDLRRARLNEGLSAREAADKIDVSEPTLLAAERNERMPQPKVALKIATFYEKLVSEVWQIGDGEVAAA